MATGLPIILEAMLIETSYLQHAGPPMNTRQHARERRVLDCGLVFGCGSPPGSVDSGCRAAALPPSRGLKPIKRAPRV